MLVSALVLVIAAVSGYAWAQSQSPPAPNGQIIVSQTGGTYSNNAGPVALTTSMGPVNASAANQHDVRVNTLANDTFVVVKDVTDSQIVFIYRVDQLGKVTLSDKKRFYY